MKMRAMVCIIARWCVGKLSGAFFPCWPLSQHYSQFQTSPTCKGKEMIWVRGLRGSSATVLVSQHGWDHAIGQNWSSYSWEAKQTELGTGSQCLCQEHVTVILRPLPTPLLLKTHPIPIVPFGRPYFHQETARGHLSYHTV